MKQGKSVIRKAGGDIDVVLQIYSWQAFGFSKTAEAMKARHSLSLLLGLLITACAPNTVSSTEFPFTQWTVGAYRSSIPHAPKPSGWTQTKTVGVKFREYEASHPQGKWIITSERPGAAIQIITHSGKNHGLTDEWYPEEGGADSAAPYVFVKGDETWIILQGTSAMTYEETHIRFKGEEMTELRRNAAKGPGMGEGAPGVEPKHKVYPPL